jgi:hypothetical protein
MVMLHHLQILGYYFIQIYCYFIVLFLSFFILKGIILYDFFQLEIQKDFLEEYIAQKVPFP